MKPVNNILLIDDDFITNFINENVIKKTNNAFQISIASNGFQGLEEVKESCFKDVGKNDDCPTLILLDINMPGMNGFEFLHELKLLDGAADQIIVFMLTSSDHSKDLQSAQNFKISGYIIKPLTDKKFTDVLTECLDL